MDQVKIRKSNREDCTAVQALIQELADYENMSSGPKIDAKILERDGFDTNPPLFICYVAENAEKLVGYAISYYSYSTWAGRSMYLEDLYVSLDYRKLHIGSQLLKAVANEAVKANCNTMDFTVLKWNPAQEFYRHYGATDLTAAEDWHLYRFSKEALKKLLDKVCKISFYDTLNKLLSQSNEESNIDSARLGKKKIFIHPWGCQVIAEELKDRAQWEIRDTKPLPIDETILEELEQKGFLTDRLIMLGSSNLTKSPENNQLFVFAKCVLKQMCLTDITMIHYHCYLQYIDFSYNDIEDATPLSGIPYLMYLNLSHNKIQHVLKFSPPWYLTCVDLSYNCIKNIRDLTEFWSIVKLDLSHNLIEIITGLQNLKYLQYLNLSYNLIECIENLDGLKIQELNLEGNYITTFKTSVPGIWSLPNLRALFLARNRISSLSFIQSNCALRIIDLKFNRISDLGQISNFKSSIYEIDLRENPCTNWPNYKDLMLFTIPTIQFLDGSEISYKEKVPAASLFSTPVELAAARSVTKLTLLEMLNFPKIDKYVFPYDETCPPLIILCGPSAVKKVALAMHICKTIPQKIKYCQWHTTREIIDNDDYKAFLYVNQEEFNTKTRNGEFIAIQEHLGHSYGFHVDQISSLVLENKIGITQTDLHTSLQMRARYTNIKSVLVLTKSEDIHRNWIKDRFDVYTLLKGSLADLLSVKIGKFVEKGTYDSFSYKLEIVSDIIEELLENLDLPDYTYWKSQAVDLISVSITSESMTLLPKQLKKRSEYEKEERRRIQFQLDDEDDEKEFPSDNFYSTSEIGESSCDLKVILDEKSNIIIDDLEYEKLKKKKLKRRPTIIDVMKQPSFEGYIKRSCPSVETILNLSQRNAESRDKVEELKNMFTELEIKSREVFLQLHDKKPGFFSLVLFTDDYLAAYNTLGDFIFKLYVNQSINKPTPCPEIQYLSKVTIPNRAELILNEIESINK
ncbi:uncharacterized protein [Prorops nasuta]|uniref:uncharacterized protein n=1 Tax=Prorops nasuta TaxID=863751 RepID=UPI0034CF22AA